MLVGKGAVGEREGRPAGAARGEGDGRRIEAAAASLPAGSLEVAVVSTSF